MAQLRVGIKTCSNKIPLLPELPDPLAEVFKVLQRQGFVRGEKPRLDMRTKSSQLANAR